MECIAELLFRVGAVSLRAEEPFFTFASGIRSPIYTDNRLLLGDPEARRKVCDALLDRADELDLEPEAVAGTATAGIPHATLFAERLGLPLLYVRGGAKQHGKGQQVEGGLKPGAKVLLIEDLISTGGSSVAAAVALRAAGAEVMHVVSIFTYGFPAAEEAFRARGFAASSLLSFEDVVAWAEKDGRLGRGQADLLRRWRESPETWPPDKAEQGRAEAPSAAVARNLVVAADLADRAEIERLARALVGIVGHLKLNSAFIAHGPPLVAAIRALGLEIFLDLKFHDIPNTAANHVREAARMGVDLLTVHAGGGAAMIQACAEAAREAGGEGRPRILAVTALTSLDDEALAQTGVEGGRGAQVARLAQLARDSGADGVVCAVAEAPLVRERCGEGFLICTPGVRPLASTADDHARAASPREAVAAGADHIVVGRPVYRADAPAEAARLIADELRSAAPQKDGF